ncbi:hypothetical protein SLEP1_g14214 [Rubroshorea leprosula]|uniref:Uncharacterized protein n=1 Tax=Rubroshorea leprosula TaxID=152421 RepID=A0AAV5IMS6_9ROSI|nr:hypothetical protein SLEP1_g14214 [Rubroshorea leprosula]
MGLLLGENYLKLIRNPIKEISRNLPQGRERFWTAAVPACRCSLPLLTSQALAGWKSIW